MPGNQVSGLISVGTGPVGRPGTAHPDCTESPLPGICRDLVGSSLAVLGQSCEEETVADGLVGHFLQVHDGLLALSQAHEEQDEESQEDRKQPHGGFSALALGEGWPAVSGV